MPFFFVFAAQLPINPYGRSKKMAEDVILDYAQSNKALAVTILRCWQKSGRSLAEVWQKSDPPSVR